MHPDFPVQILVSTPSGPLPLTAQRARLLLPRGPDSQGPELAYGPYMNALSDFLARDSYGPLRAALGKHMGRTVASREIQNMELISEKHGALYHVSRVRVQVAGEKICNLVMNVATTLDQQAFLENECNLLDHLHTRFDLPYLPHPYLLGETLYQDERNTRQSLKLFIAEWFEGFHEFHLSQREGESTPVLRVWYLDEAEEILSPEQSRSLYRQAAFILTAYLDEKSFGQIYPWHHAAGDFIVKPRENDVELKLVTARDYRCLLASSTGQEDLWIALVHFFLNLTLRLRLDRLDGTGELAWASPVCLPSIISGFLQAWSQKAQEEASLPTPPEVMEALRGFTLEEWQALAGIVMEDGVIETDELTDLQSCIDEHLRALHGFLQAEIP